MISLNEILTLGELVIWSAAIAGDDNPASLLLVGRPESGKSQVIKALGGNQYTYLANDTTAWGMARKILPEMRKLRSRVLLIPDLTNPLSRNRESVSSFVGLLAAFMEEGISRIVTKYIQLSYPTPMKGGVLTSMTLDELRHRKAWWLAGGFLSRFLVISYTYSNDSTADIMEHLRLRAGKDKDESVSLSLPYPPVEIQSDKDTLAPLDDLALDHLAALGMENSAFGFRALNNCTRLTLGAALRRGSRVVQPEDVQLICHLVGRYGNLQCQEAR